MKKVLTALALAISSAQAGYCADLALNDLKNLAKNRDLPAVSAVEPKAIFGAIFSPSYDAPAPGAALMPFYLMAPRQAYTAHEAGVDSGYPVLKSHAVIPDKENLLKAVNFWSLLLERSGLTLYKLDANQTQAGYVLEIFYSGPEIKSFDASSAGLVYDTAADAARAAAEVSGKIENAGGKVLEKLTVTQDAKFSFAVYFTGGSAARGSDKAIDLFDAYGQIAAIIDGTHQVGSVISGAAGYLADTGSVKSDYKGDYKSAAKAVSSMLSAASGRKNLAGLEIYSNERGGGRIYSYLVFWRGAGF